MKGIFLTLFIGFLLFSGLFCMRRTKTLNDFFLGGRSVGPWLSAFAYGTTYFSAVIFIGYAGKVGWGFGLSSLWIVVGNTLLGSLLAWWVLAKRTRQMTFRLNALTMPQFLEARYQSPGFKIFAASIIFVFMIPYSASVFMGLSYLFEQVFNIPYTYATIIMALLTAMYLVTGGYRAVALTDMVQGSIMIFGVFALLYYVLGAPQIGGLDQVVNKLQAINPKLTGPVGPPGFLPIASLVILTSLGTWGLPQMVQKFYAIKDEASIRPATIVSTLFALIITTGAYFTGSLTRLFFDKVPVDALTGKPNPDLMVPKILMNTLPEWAVTLILLLVLSASMSTLASLVLVSSSAVTIDLLQGLYPTLPDGRKVGLMRLFCALFIALSVALALAKPTIILSLMAVSWGTIAGAFLAPYLMGLYWRRATATGAWIASLTGLTISLLFSFYVKLDAGMLPMIGSLAMLIPLLVLPLVSMVTEPLSEDHLEQVFGERCPTGTLRVKNKKVEQL
ncbi:SSS sodium solute transporter superfamily [Desulforamulus reducens MI-1]|uniref:SSS sodium solute transporter superfamily n=1 Tax=Desulforamulus reducens (strain ATCC BAA-1160 / DSM 100696 / MI-1) TaxID=349161 RepID=A4J9E0_DESRM|nr:sodium/solute symporter [Desulforamulus reducens]ABO51693.1 SSS sodium solute transporter superfamily [Desulforamulus reducens MI-1]